MQSQSLRELYERVAPLAPEVRPETPLRASNRSAGSMADQVANDKPSISRRMFRAFVRFCIAVLIGVSATLAWQLHGNDAEKFVGTWFPSLNQFLSIATSTQNITLPQSAATAQISTPAVAVTSSEMAQQLKTIASDLAHVRNSLAELTEVARNVTDTRRSVEQVAARQEQIAESVAALQRFEQDVKQRLASAPQQPRSVPLPTRKPPLPTADSPAAQASSLPGTVPSTQQPLPLR
jgi:hypothetical protein